MQFFERSKIKKAICGTISAVLTLVLLLGCAVVPSSGADVKKNETPVIFVAGFVSTDTVDTETGEALFPPTAKTIRKAVGDAIKPVLKSALHGEFRGLDYPLNQAILSLLDGIRCDENGDPIDPHTDTAYRIPSPEEIRAKYHDDVGYTSEDAIYYSYDWRLDLRTLAEQLHDFIEYVLESTGAEKVDVIAYSMGSCVLSSYMNLYGGEYIESLILYLGAMNGSSTCGDPFNNNLGMDSETFMAAVNGLIGTGLKQEVYKAMLDILYREGVVDAAVCITEKVLDRVFDDLYKQSMPYIFGRIPGFWAMIPAEAYDNVRDTFVSDVVTEEFYEKVDYYHNVQLGLVDTIRNTMSGGTSVSIFVKYGYPQSPIIRSRKTESDFVVDVVYCSFGATCPPYDETFAPDYQQQNFPEKNYISPDRKIDASTCAFPDTTWFIKNSTHIGTLSGGVEGEQAMTNWVLSREGQPTVWDNADYPQFNTYLPDGSCVPLTAENDWSVLGDYSRSADIIERIKKIFEDLGRIFSLLIEMIRG